MSGPQKTHVWDGMTRSHAFVVDVFLDGEQGLYTAHINAHTPALATALRPPGKSPERIQIEPGIEVRHHDLDVLKGQVKVEISSRHGDIVQFRERET